MNNGKVRIYELSRELNLDNKDLLTICEQLNIAVKSHSSTISETDAERIRAAAETYAAKSPVRPPRAMTQRPSAPTPPISPRPKVESKPQILEIRQHQARPSSSPVGETATAVPPQPSARQQMPLPMKQSSLNHPARPSEPPKAPSKPTVDRPEIASPNPPAPSASRDGNRPAEPSPRLVEPPSRPSPERPQPSLVEKPILKRSKPGDPPKPTKAGSPSPQQPGNAPVADGADRPQKKVRINPPVAGKRPPGGAVPPEPVRSLDPKPVRPAAIAVSEDDEDEVAPVAEIPEELQLRRPTPPRLNKRRPAWEEEEDESAESKAAKGNVKAGKRGRVQPIIDDDDDFESDLDDLPETVQVSLSVARPPKPKSRPQPVTTPVVAEPAKRRKPAERQTQERRQSPSKPERPEKIVVTGNMTVRDLANALVLAETEIVKILFFKGYAINITQTLDLPTIELVANEVGVTVETGEEQAAATKTTEMVTEEDLENLQRRPPVVTIMGHVDHGKTSLLDAIRETKVAQGEAGGITQHIGAYHVDVEHEGATQQVVFLDTPGHEAFTAMRARGAKVTDVAILVVAADDGVQPQTVEAIRHAQAAEVPIVVAINKVDKPEAQPDRVKQELTQYGLTPEEWGGETIMVNVSALKGENLDLLLEMILLVSEVQELVANPDRAAKGTVIEAHLDKARGPVATLLVQNGTLRVGDAITVGSVYGKVRAMVDDRGDRVEAASPSFAVEVLGLNDVPAAGDEFEVMPSEREARLIATERAEQQRESRIQQSMAARPVSLNTLSSQVASGELKELNIILKADVQGSVEAILGALRQLPQNEVQLRILFAAPGEITETDVDLAAASGAVIVGFNTTFASGARQAADQYSVDVRDYNIIYKLLDDIQAAMEGLLDPEQVEEALGQVEVRAVFPVGRGAVAGCYVQSGKVIRNCRIRVKRGGKVIYEGVLDSLKRMKEDAKEVNTGFECGIGIDRFNDWAVNDIIEAYQMVSKRRTLSPA